MWNFHGQGKNGIYPIKADFPDRLLAEDGRDCSSSHIFSSRHASTANQRAAILVPVRLFRTPKIVSAGDEAAHSSKGDWDFVDRDGGD
jgi:hypothetical protein